MPTINFENDNESDDDDDEENDDDNDLYIIGAVCLSVCPAFAYFIFSLF